MKKMNDQSLIWETVPYHNTSYKEKLMSSKNMWFLTIFVFIYFINLYYKERNQTHFTPHAGPTRHMFLEVDRVEGL
jgi:hypothetical protein